MKRFLIIFLVILLHHDFPVSGSVPGQGFTFALAGDIMMGTTYPERKGNPYLPADNGRHLFDDIKSITTAADVSAANLEGVLAQTGIGKVKKCRDSTLCYAFRTPVAYVANLRDAGFDLLSVANNHAHDFGTEGVASTVKTLLDAGIAPAGNETYCRTSIIRRSRRLIGFAAFGHSRGTPSLMDLTNVRKTVARLDSLCDIVVVSFHGGGEGPRFTHVPGKMEECFGERRGDVKAMARAAVDAGADIVYGHGPHVARAIELYRGRIIAYSLGNFCTPFRVSLSGVSGHAPLLTVETDNNGRFIKGHIHSFTQRPGTGPRLDPSNAAARQIARLSREDFPQSQLDISPDGAITITSPDSHDVQKQLQR